MDEKQLVLPRLILSLGAGNNMLTLDFYKSQTSADVLFMLSTSQLLITKL